MRDTSSGEQFPCGARRTAPNGRVDDDARGSFQARANEFVDGGRAPLLVTHVPLVVVPDGCVNVHGHHHNFRPLEIGRWINVSVEHTGYRPLDVRTQVLPLARTLISGRTPDGATTVDRIGRPSEAGFPARAGMKRLARRARRW